MKKLKALFDFFAGLKFAVVIIAYLCVVIAIGTIVESRYDALAAKRMVYGSWWMFFGMGSLALSLIAVMVNRWPWKRHHTPFIFAHIGILLLLAGSLITMLWGLDGSMILPIGKSSKLVTVPETEVQLYATFDGNNFTQLKTQEIDFYSADLDREKISFPLDSSEVSLTEFAPYVIPRKKVSPSASAAAGSGVRFQIRSSRVNVVEWLVQRKSGAPASHDLGPAKVYLLGPDHPLPTGPAMVLFADSKSLTYKVLSRENKVTAQGPLAVGDEVKTNWMDLQFKLISYLPQAEESWEVEKREFPTPLTTPAIKVVYQGLEKWLLLNDTLRLFSQDASYILTFLNKRITLQDEISLVEFQQENYEGTQKAKEYRSRVRAGNNPEVTISMNRPMRHLGMLFYQASFQQDEQGKPIASVLSVNYDPGRFLKYAGSIIMTLGIILLFFFRKHYQKRS